jgi:hypothetical protein
LSIKDKAGKGYRTIRLPLKETNYSRFLEDREFARAQLEKYQHDMPELLPQEIEQGFRFFGFSAPSHKQGIRCRRIQLKANGIVFTIAPSFVLPYMRGQVKEVEKALLLRRFNVPYWALSYVFGHNHWYRLESCLGNFSLVGTTVKKASKLQQELLADEKHSKRNGKRCYIAMTVGAECILGAAQANSASESGLSKAYAVFANEAKDVKPAYEPNTVNTDGWAQKAWKRLFPKVVVILCFLHAFLKIRDRAGIDRLFNSSQRKGLASRTY